MGRRTLFAVRGRPYDRPMRAPSSPVRGTTSRRRDQSGAASLEYAGVVLVVVFLVGSVVASVTPVGQAVKMKICEALEAACGSVEDGTANALPTCTVTSERRTLGYGANIRIYNVDRADGDTVDVNADGSASFSTSQGVAGGVGTGRVKNYSGGSSVSAEAKVQLASEGTYVYNVPQDWGGAETARGMRGSRNSTLNRYGRLVVGPMATSIDEGMTRLGNGIANVSNDAWNFVTGGEDSPEEIAERAREQSLGEADALKVSLGLQGSGSVSADAGIVQGAASGKASVKGEVTIALNTDGPDAAKSAFAGVVDVNGELAATLGWSGQGRPGEQSTGDIPPFLQMALGGGKTWSYAVEYDSDGDPVQLTVTTESRDGLSLGLTGKAGGLTSGSGLGTVSTGDVAVNQTVLDLTVPENREAFDGLFTTYGVGVGDHQARVSQMLIWPGDLDEMGARMAALQERFVADALNVQYVYESSGTGLTATGQKKEDGFDVAVAGVSWQDSSETRTLESAVAYDFRQGGLEVPLASGCGG